MQKWQRSFSRFLPRLIVVLIVIAAIFLFHYNQTVELNTKEVLSHETTIIELGKTNLTRNFEAVIADLLIVSNLVENHIRLENDIAKNRQHLSDSLLNFSNMKGVYAQIRFIDARGMEKLRIDYNGKEAFTVPAQQLQPKGHRYYVQESLRLNKGEVYVSPLDLNIENGVVERPFKPMIRFATPAFDEQGNKLGIVAINYFGNAILEQFVESHLNATGEIMLLNRDGYWLHAETPDDEWGFMFPKRMDLTFGNRFPAAWETIHNKDIGSIQTDEGLFIFTTVFPLIDSIHVQKGIAIYSSSDKKSGSPAQYQWKIISHFTPEKLTAIKHTYAQRLMGAFLILSITITFILWLITSTQKIKKKAAENQMKAAIQDGALDAIISFDPKGAIAEFNPAATDSFGYTHEEAMAENFFDLVHYRNQEILSPKSVTSLLNQHLRGTAIHQGGRHFPIDFSIVRIGIGEEYLYTCFIRDITEQVEAEERYQLIFSQAADAIINIDLESKRIVEFNDQACKQLGYTREEFEKLSIYDIDTHATEQEIARYIEKLTTQRTFETQHSMKTGELLDILVNARPVTIGNDKIISAICTDITPQKRIEKQLQVRENELRTILDSTAEGIYGVDRNGNCIMVNRACLEMIGLESEKDVLGKSMHALLQHRHKDGTPYPMEESNIFQALHHGTKSHTTNEVFWRKDGTSFPVEYYAHPMSENGNITGAVITFMDISERLSLEEQFRQAQKMESIGTLVGGIAHEFNNLLAGITGNIYLAKHDLDQPQKALKELEQIESLSFKAADMIQQLLSFARKGVVELKTFNLTAFIKESIKLNRFVVPESITFRTEICPEQLNIHGDANQIQQVLINLLSNASEALKHKKDGEIILRLEKKRVDEQLQGKYPKFAGKELAHIALEDNGRGILEENLQQVFDPFFTTKDVGEGTGLGLAMAYGALQTHQGAIEVRSSKNQGTRVHLYIPLHIEAEKRKETQTEKGALRGAGETILIVDDDDIVRTISVKVLQSLGYKTLEATDGLQAVELFRNNQSLIAATIMDIVMPNMGGVDAAREIRALQPDANIIFATAYDREAAVDEVPELKGMPLLRKPFPVEEITKTLYAMLHPDD